MLSLMASLIFTPSLEIAGHLRWTCDHIISQPGTIQTALAEPHLSQQRNGWHDCDDRRNGTLRYPLVSMALVTADQRNSMFDVLQALSNLH